MKLELRRGQGAALEARRGEDWVAVMAKCCFPWTEPERHISLRDAQGEEVGFVADLAALDGEAAEALRGALAVSAFVFEVRKIVRISQDIELRVWEVETLQGLRKFQTELDAWPVLVPGGSRLIRDVTGDLYLIPPPERMDEASRRAFWAFVD